MKIIKGYVVSDCHNEVTEYDVFRKKEDAIENGQEDFSTAILYEVHYIPIKKVIYRQTRVEDLSTKERK